MPEGTPPAKPRDAATIVVTRPAARDQRGLEILLLERPKTSRFAAGAYVFPGGAVDADDAHESWQGRLPATGESPSCAAALRELFEETGLLPGAALDPSDPNVVAARAALLEDATPFTEIRDAFELDFSAVDVAYFARWITPRTLATRFDTRFFLLALAQPDVEVLLTSEHESYDWLTPDVALDRFAAGALPMLFPTRKTLEKLAEFEDLEHAFEALREVAVEPIMPKLDTRGEHVRPLMPGDDGYDEIY